MTAAQAPATSVEVLTPAQAVQQALNALQMVLNPANTEKVDLEPLLQASQDWHEDSAAFAAVHWAARVVNALQTNTPIGSVPHCVSYLENLLRNPELLDLEVQMRERAVTEVDLYDMIYDLQGPSPAELEKEGLFFQLRALLKATKGNSEEERVQLLKQNVVETLGLFL